jgi:polysaccharide biosynthesis transport protein
MSQPPDTRSDPRALPPGDSGTALATAPAAPALAGRDLARLAASPHAEEPHFWDYWRVLVRHRWTIISVFLVTVMAGMVHTFTTRPVYTATATLRLEKEEPRVVKFEEVVRPGPEPDYYQTQHKLLQSRALANRVIGLLELDQHAEFAQPEDEVGWTARARAWAREQLVRWMPMPPPTAEEAADLILESPLTRAFLGRLSVEAVRNTRLVNVSFQSHYPDLAARVVNTVAEAFIAQQLEQKIEASRYATQFLAKQIDEARVKLEESETALNQFLRTNNILFVVPGNDANARPQDLVTQQLTMLSNALLEARADRIAKESQFRQALGQQANAAPAVLQSSLVAKLKEERATLQGEYRRLSQSFKPDYPKMRRLAESIAEVNSQLRTEISQTIDGLKADYQAAARNEHEIEKALIAQQALVRQLDEQMGQYNLLRREVDTSSEFYSSLLNRLREIQISAALLTSNISIVDPAEVPGQPSKPQKSLNLLLASLVGLVGGVGLAFFLEYLDTNIKDAREVEAALHVPTLGLVPSQGALGGRRARRLRRVIEEAEPVPLALASHADVGSVMAEAFRNLRTSLLYSAPDHPPKTFLVTSLQPEDGKTSLAMNLAITLAQLGSGEILLVDGDMRRPNVHELLTLPQAPGFSTFLTGQAELPEVLTPTTIPNLYAIPAGRVPLNPAELMASRRLGQTLEALSQRFAHIIFDTPPLFGVSDPLILAPRVEGVVLVLRHGRASRDAAQHAVRLLASVHARVLGVVLNDIQVGGAGSYGYYGDYGYYGYGNGQPQHADS